MTFGVTGDFAANPDLDVLARGIEDGIRELRDAAERPQPATAKRTSRPPKATAAPAARRTGQPGKTTTAPTAKHTGQPGKTTTAAAAKHTGKPRRSAQTASG